MKFPLLVFAVCLSQTGFVFAAPLSVLVASENSELNAKIAAYRQQCGEKPAPDEICVKRRYELGAEIGKFVVLANEELALLEPGNLAPDISPKDRQQFMTRRGSIDEMVRLALNELKSLGMPTSHASTRAPSLSPPAQTPVPPSRSSIQPRADKGEAHAIAERVNAFFERHQTPDNQRVEKALRLEFLSRRFQRERAEEDKHPEEMDGDPYTLSDGGWDVGAIRVAFVDLQGSRAEASMTRAGDDHGMKVSLVKENGKWLLDRIYFSRNNR